MTYNKLVEDGYITAIGTNMGATDITEQEYNEILAALADKPSETETIWYRLKTDLTWEQYEKEPIPEPEPTAEEIVSILTGEAE